MAEYPLKTLLGLRRREEDVAAEAWGKAVGERARAEGEAERLAEVARAIEGRLAAACASDPPSALPASEVMAAARFQQRLRDELARAIALHETYRRGPLARARAEEESAGQEVVERRRAREALEKHEDQFREGQRLEAERRADDQNDELARFARHDRRPRHEPEG